ncbi:11414_t:CDS:10, partial [Funneliformis geosporum]
MLIARPEYFTNPDSKEKWLTALHNKVKESKETLEQVIKTEPDKLSKIARLETTIQELTQAKTQISQQTQTEFSTQNKGTQTELTAEQITKLEQDSQTFLKLLQATEQELTNTKKQLTQIQEQLTNQNQEKVQQDQKITHLEQQKTKNDQTITSQKETITNLQGQIAVKKDELQQAKEQNNKLSSELETAKEKNNTYLENIKSKEGIINNNNQQIKQLQTSQTELTNTIKQLQSKIKLLEQQKENYQTKYDQSINFIKEIREDSTEKQQLAEIRKQAIQEAGKLKKVGQGKETNSVEVICTEQDIFHSKKSKVFEEKEAKTISYLLEFVIYKKVIHLDSRFLYQLAKLESLDNHYHSEYNLNRLIHTLAHEVTHCLLVQELERLQKDNKKLRNNDGELLTKPFSKLSEKLEKHLIYLEEVSKRPKDFIIQEALIQYLENAEDVAKYYKEERKKGEKGCTTEEMLKEINLKEIGVGLRISEAVSFDLSLEHQQTEYKNLYLLRGKVKEEMNITENIELSPHTLRRCFATHQAISGMPLPVLQKVLGHSKVSTTALYIRDGDLVTKIIDELLLETKKALVKGEEVRFLGYFSFKTTMTKPRIAMNLQTKKKMKVPAKKVPKCKFSTNLKEAIIEGKEINFTVEEGKNGANDKDSLEQVKNPKRVSVMATKTIKLKQLNLNPLSVA